VHKGSVLLIDDEEKILVSLSSTLRENGFSVLSTTDGNQALPLINAAPVEAVILDLIMPAVDGMTVLGKIIEERPCIPVIMLTGHGTIAKAVEATKAGAFDFLEKPIESAKIIITLENAIKKSRLERDRFHLLQDALTRYRMVGVSKAIKETFAVIEKVAPSDSRILISGESGTGKELIARAIHLRSDRAGRPFIVVNCAAIPEELIESELFGHEKGAFTGAIQLREGKFVMASGGTLFLDEVGDMSPRIQAKVLRVIEDGEIQRVGGRESIKTNVRVIAASNRDLKFELREKKFREDLYFRLNVIHVQVPPLRERREDIPILLDYFLRQLCEERKRPLLRVEPSAMDVFVTYSWPGNVRELRNLLENLVVMSSGNIITRGDIEEILAAASPESLVKSQSGENAINAPGPTLASIREKSEREAIVSRLSANSWNYEQSARELGISRATLFNKIRQLGIKRPHEGIF
jgi:DNA-binding NtrC family response regulator